MNVFNETDFENNLALYPAFFLLDLITVVLLLIATIWFCAIWESMRRHQLQLAEKYQCLEDPHTIQNQGPNQCSCMNNSD